MPKYVMANRRAGMFTAEEKAESKKVVGDSFARLFTATTQVIQDSDPQEPPARRVIVFEADADEAAAKQKELPPEVLLEPVIPHYLDLRRPADFLRRAGGRVITARAGLGQTLAVTVRGGGGALEGADVILFLRAPFGNQAERKGRTNASGKVEFQFSSFWSPAALVVLPAGGFWSQIVRGPSGAVTVDCPALPDADKHLGWWHTTLGVTRFLKTRGKEIKVGVIGTPRVEEGAVMTYLIAVKREARKAAPADWLKSVRVHPGGEARRAGERAGHPRRGHPGRARAAPGQGRRLLQHRAGGPPQALGEALRRS